MLKICNFSVTNALVFRIQRSSLRESKEVLLTKGVFKGIVLKICNVSIYREKFELA